MSAKMQSHTMECYPAQNESASFSAVKIGSSVDIVISAVSAFLSPVLPGDRIINGK